MKSAICMLLNYQQSLCVSYVTYMSSQSQPQPSLCLTTAMLRQHASQNSQKLCVANGVGHFRTISDCIVMLTSVTKAVFVSVAISKQLNAPPYLRGVHESFQRPWEEAVPVVLTRAISHVS